MITDIVAFLIRGLISDFLNVHNYLQLVGSLVMLLDRSFLLLSDGIESNRIVLCVSELA